MFTTFSSSYGSSKASQIMFAVVMGRNVAVVEWKLCWSDALFYCRDFYWDLLSIRSEEEQREVEEVLRNVSFPLTKHVLTTSLLNVAPSGTASQSSTHDLGDAWRAIDGNRNPEFFNGSCSHTLFGLSHWWSLLLPAVYRITSISITNRNFIPHKINNVKILIGNSLENNGNNNPSCAVISSIPSGGTRTFNCGGMIGRLINLYLNGTGEENVLTVCELEVYGEVAPPSPSFSAVVMGRNVAVVEWKLCWSDALFYCRDFYWDLLSIRSEEEQREVEEVLRNVSFPLTKHVWLGLRRYLTGDTWFWMSGASESYTYWETEAMCQDTSPCGGMGTSDPFHWRNLPCGDHLNFICVKDIQRDKNRVEFYSSTRP